MFPRLCECCRQSRAEGVSNNKNKILKPEACILVKPCRWTMLIGWVKCRQNEEGGKHPENFVNIFNGRPLAQGGCYVKWARSCHVVPKQSDWWLVTMQVALSDLPPHAHTARISRVSLIEMAHRIWVRELNGYAKIYIWHDFPQFPTSLVWEKWQRHSCVMKITSSTKGKLNLNVGD